MKSLFDPVTRRELIDRLERLTADSKREWGTLSPVQMLAHCRIPMQVATGEAQIRRTLMGRLFGPFIKKLVLGPDPFKRGLPSDKQFFDPTASAFDGEKEKVRSLLQRLGDVGPGALSGAPHPFFGPLKPDQWGWLLYKHLDHHLRQFGV